MNTISYQRKGGKPGARNTCGDMSPDDTCATNIYGSEKRESLQPQPKPPRTGVEVSRERREQVNIIMEQE
jgi:hypothetical protein